MNDELVGAVAQIIRLGRGWDSSDVAREIIPLVLEHAGGERPVIVRIDPSEYQDGVYLNPVTGQVIRIEGDA